jgi:hypothetical protein
MVRGGFWCSAPQELGRRVAPVQQPRRRPPVIRLTCIFSMTCCKPCILHPVPSAEAVPPLPSLNASACLPYLLPSCNLPTHSMPGLPLPASPLPACPICRLVGETDKCTLTAYLPEGQELPENAAYANGEVSSRCSLLFNPAGVVDPALRLSFGSMPAAECNDGSDS